ncbi:ganglioside GM2 activator-like [Haliotis rubra]|uniref:ganglioside GM2 activator-like n=1 Tax=Haliotis rubra TaxID=36100 RepID=UPI001EE5F5FF|nr:ganglioside GM2 activator-like [Haliotis rubra]
MKAVNIFTLLCLTWGAGGSGVFKFKSYDENAKDVNDILDILMRRRTPERYQPDSYFHKYGISLSSKLTSFSYKDCGDPSTETARLLDLEISPDPIELPGEIQVAFKVVNLQRAESPIKTDVTLWKKVLGMWIEAPCMHNMGSCSYRDFCGLLERIPCPQAFRRNKIPCKCPFPAGNYTLPTTKFEVNLSTVPSGDYCIRIKMGSSTQTCYEIYLSVD